MYFDPLYLVFLAPGLLLSLWASFKVKSTFRHFSEVPARSGYSGAQAAAELLQRKGIRNVRVEEVQGFLSDHYDPSERVLRLSPDVYHGRSLAALGVAAHEAGHAIQHATAYGPLVARTNIVPVVNIGSNLGFIVLIAGIFMQMTGLAWAGVALFSLSTLFALITLPVEFDASKRAKVALVQAGIVDNGVQGGQEIKGVDNVLDAAAWTYIAGFAASLMTLLYYVMMVTGMSRSND
jgi:Zn-dependent membrane protease YugP